MRYSTKRPKVKGGANICFSIRKITGIFELQKDGVKTVNSFTGYNTHQTEPKLPKQISSDNNSFFNSARAPTIFMLKDGCYKLSSRNGWRNPEPVFGEEPLCLEHHTKDLSKHKHALGLRGFRPRARVGVPDPRTRERMRGGGGVVSTECAEERNREGRSERSTEEARAAAHQRHRLLRLATPTGPQQGLALPAPARLLTSLTSCRHSSTARLLLQVCLGHTRVTSSLQNSSSASFQPPPAPPGPAPLRRAGSPPAGKGGCGG